MKEINNIPAMTPPEVHEYLQMVGTNWSGKGVAMELGCWLGATSVPLLRGLVKAGYDKSFWAFDRWIVNTEQMQMAKDQGYALTHRQDSSLVYLENVNAVYNNIEVVKGDMPNSLTRFVPEPIEIMIFDAPKKNPVFQDCMDHLLPHCIPGVTIIGLLDYHFWKVKKGNMRRALRDPVKFIRSHSDNFELLQQWGKLCACAFFKYVKQV